jgi:hypothetical protein
MSETSETPTVRSSTATAPAPATTVEHPVHRTPRVFQVAAWVAIVAGIVFIVATIFFSGYSLGKHSGGGHHHGHHHHAAMMHPRFHQGGPGGPNAIQPGATPSSVAPAPAGPSQIPSSVLPSRTP